MKSYYDIHGIVKIKTNLKGCFPEYFRADKLNDIDLEIIESDFEFDKDSYSKIGSFYGDNKTIYFESTFYGIPIYRILIKDIEGKTKLYFTKTTNRIFNVQKLAFILFQIKLLQKHFTLLHAGGVSKGTKGSVIFGWPGVGKSSTLFGLIENESFELLGDDAVIISNKKKVYAYPQKVGVFFKSEHFKTLELTKLQTLELSLRYLISKIPPFNRYIGAKLMVDISNVAEFKKMADIDQLYFLETGNGTDKLNKTIAINRIIASTIQSFFDHYLSNKMFYAYCYATGFDPGYIEKGMRHILSKSVNSRPLILRSDRKDFHKYFIQ